MENLPRLMLPFSLLDVLIPRLEQASNRYHNTQKITNYQHIHVAHVQTLSGLSSMLQTENRINFFPACVALLHVDDVIEIFVLLHTSYFS